MAREHRIVWNNDAHTPIEENRVRPPCDATKIKARDYPLTRHIFIESSRQLFCSTLCTEF